MAGIRQVAEDAGRVLCGPGLVPGPHVLSTPKGVPLAVPAQLVARGRPGGLAPSRAPRPRWCAPSTPMTAILELLRARPAARRFFLAQLQSSLGTGIGYVALVLVAYERFHSSWAVAAVLVADLLPLMAMGPLLGGAADRLPRRACAVSADLVRAVAFIGIAATDNLTATLLLAALAGAGTGVFNPAILAGLPRLAGEQYSAAATSLFSAVSTLGKTLGPLVAAAVLLGGGVELALAVNGVTFLISAALLLSVDLGRAAPGEAEDGDDGAPVPAPRPRLVPGFVVIAAASSGAALFAGMANVAEPPFIVDGLDGATSGYSLMVGLYGLGIAAGSLAGSGGGGVGRLWARYLAGIAAMGCGYAAAALAPVFALCLPGFILAGAGNGLLMVHERLLVQAIIPEAGLGRAFGTLDMVASWAFAAALAAGAASVAGLGARGALLLAGFGTVAVWLGATLGSTARRPIPEASG